MPHVLKPAFEQFRHDLHKSGKPLRERDVVPIQAAVIASLDKYKDLLVEKVRRQPQADAMVEISARWLGLASEPDDIMRALRHGWSDEVLGAKHAKFHVGPNDDDAILLSFAGAYEESRFITGRMKVTI